MSQSRTMANLEADIVALRATADRAGTALACLFSTSDEFEAAVVKVRREQGAFRTPSRPRQSWRAIALVAVIALAFVLF